MATLKISLENEIEEIIKNSFILHLNDYLKKFYNLDRSFLKYL